MPFPDVTGLKPGDLIEGHPLGTYVLGECGDGMAASEWRAGFRVCEHCTGTSNDPAWADEEDGDWATDEELEA